MLSRKLRIVFKPCRQPTGHAIGGHDAGQFEVDAVLTRIDLDQQPELAIPITSRTQITRVRLNNEYITSDRLGPNNLIGARLATSQQW